MFSITPSVRHNYIHLMISNLIQGGAKRTHVFQIIVTLFIFNIKNYVNTKTTCNKCSFGYLHCLLNYGKFQGGAKRTHRVSAMSLVNHAHQIYLPEVSFFGVISNQKSTFENLVQSTIRKFPFAKKLQLCHKKC